MLQDRRKRKRKLDNYKNAVDDIFSNSEKNGEKDLNVTITKMKNHLSDLTDNILNVYVDMIFTYVEQRKISECTGCINGRRGDSPEHDCFEMPEKDFLEKCITQVGL